ncbi:hypothetical protein TIFTF001_031012 [Ficus carica]|uniref:Uncharacterized protein n=1 Tax=Ficus carica TaxID=3494 RepID=A0AA88J4X1_FICCA|nr:hypothetical protein TIFTF001_031012 [Ficus carica]
MGERTPAAGDFAVPEHQKLVEGGVVVGVSRGGGPRSGWA